MSLQILHVNVRGCLTGGLLPDEGVPIEGFYTFRILLIHIPL